MNISEYEYISKIWNESCEKRNLELEDDLFLLMKKIYDQKSMFKWIFYDILLG